VLKVDGVIDIAGCHSLMIADVSAGSN
jgi:hypothetical protein